MKVITIEQLETGGKTTIINEEGFVVHDSNYKNSLNLIEDLRKFCFRGYEIVSKEIKDNKIVLTRNDGCIINLINFNHNVLLDEINQKVYKSFKNGMLDKSNEKIKNIYLMGSKDGSNFECLELSDGLRCVIHFELDEKGELTEINKKMLEEFINKEFKNWFRIFFCTEEEGVLRVFCDDKAFTIDSGLIKYVKPKAEEMEAIYFSALENINKKRGI